MRGPLTVFTSLLVAAVVALSTGAAGADPSGRSNDPQTLLTWNSVAVSTLATAKLPPPEQWLYTAYVQSAVYDAVVAIDRRAPQYRLHLHASHPASTDAAIAAAAHDILVAYFPAQSPTLDSAYGTSLALVPDGTAKTEGIAVGQQAAAGIISLRAGDGLNGPTIAPLPPGPGVWQPTPPNTLGIDSWLGDVTPFLLDSVTRYAPPGPPALTSARWARDYNETRLYGSATSTVRTAAQTETARFWSAPPLGQQQAALQNLILQRGLGLDAAATLLAVNAMADTDSLIVCFRSKYANEFWRPFTAIPAGDTDGNPATVADPSWVPLLLTPDHPEYPSAHSCGTAGALATVLTAFLHTDRIDLDVASSVTGTTHHFATAQELSDEVANARVWGGIHWRTSTEDGTTIGQRVARYDLRQFPGQDA